MWSVEFTDEFGAWFNGLDERVQDAIDQGVQQVEMVGPSLGRPQVDSIKGSRHANMKELRVQVGGEPFRIFFAFDPRRAAILLIGGSKQGGGRFYEVMVPIADDLYDVYLRELRMERLIP